MYKLFKSKIIILNTCLREPRQNHKHRSPLGLWPSGRSPRICTVLGCLRRVAEPEATGGVQMRPRAQHVKATAAGRQGTSSD